MPSTDSLYRPNDERSWIRDSRIDPLHELRRCRAETSEAIVTANLPATGLAGTNSVALVISGCAVSPG